MKKFKNLSPRETQVFWLRVEGLSIRKIGQRLQLKEKTVHTMLKTIHLKLGVHSRAEIVTVVINEKFEALERRLTHVEEKLDDLHIAFHYAQPAEVVRAETNPADC